MIHRSQLLVRDCGASRSSFNFAAIGSETRRDYAMIGIAEVDEDRYPEHIVHGFICYSNDRAILLHSTDHQKSLGREGQASDLGSLATHNIWPRPDPLYGVGGGGIVLRDCRMPAEPGKKIVLVLAVASLPAGTLKNHHMYEAHGNIGSTTANSLIFDNGRLELTNPVETEIKAGESLATLLKMTLWGWGDEKIAFRSTMDLVTIDQCERIETLQEKPQLTEAERSEYDDLIRSEVGWIFRHTADDKTYQAYRREMVKMRPRSRWDSVITKIEQEEEGRIAAEIIRRLLPA
jgi:hypothetical protein